MMQSSPRPLSIALDLTKRLHHELAKHLTPEQKRDFMRVERLIAENDGRHTKEMPHATNVGLVKSVSQTHRRASR